MNAITLLESDNNLGFDMSGFTLSSAIVQSTKDSSKKNRCYKNYAKSN